MTFRECMQMVLITSTIGPNVSKSNRVTTIWHGTKAKISRLVRHTSPNTRITNESACRLPPEIVGVVIAHLTDDLNALKTCSLTCRSWYTAAVPYIHHTLLLGDTHHAFLGQKEWRFRNHLRPLSKLHGRGLMPLVKEVRVRQGYPTWFGPRAFSSRDLRYFSAFTNVQSLSIQQLNIGTFIPGIERYFEQFSPTLRSISLFQPTCRTNEQLPYFLSLFPNLDDIDISEFGSPGLDISDAVLAPFSAPKLRGELVLHMTHSAETWAYMIAACGGLRFRHMELHEVGDSAQMLLEACAGTLETLRFSLVGNAR